MSEDKKLEVRAIFMAKTKEDKEIYMPFFRELLKEHPNILVYNYGPVCQEIKDRNVVVTTDIERDADLIKEFNCGAICLSGSTPLDMGILAIVKEAEKGSK
jgi:hypothetical protein